MIYKVLNFLIICCLTRKLKILVLSYFTVCDDNIDYADVGFVIVLLNKTCGWLVVLVLTAL